ncbi:MAG: hypothetical protein I8H77_01755 [Comamonadaceae bacterium]|nr:hypothetical protein [Comamonadaceae bacterium]
MEDTILVVDCGTTSLRFSLVSKTGQTVTTRRAVVPAHHDADGISWDGNAIASCILREVEALVGDEPIAGIAIANQRTTCLVWDAQTSQVLGPVLSWSDGRTRDLDRALRGQGVRHVANLTGSKLRWLLDRVDPDRALSNSGRLKGGTLDSWIVWTLSGGKRHLSDHVNASHSGLFDIRKLAWDDALAASMGVPLAILPSLVPCTGPFGAAEAVRGQPPILALIGDQQASLLGQGCVKPGATKITFGTVGVVSSVLGSQPLASHGRAAFGNIALSTGQGVRYGVETSMQSAGSAIEWLIRTGLLDDASNIDALVDPTHRSEAIFVSALDGLGAPHWKPAARAAFMGLSSANGRGDMARAVLDGIACATSEILDLLEQATQLPLENISIDGGLSASRVFRDILVTTAGRPMRHAAHIESTTFGAAVLGFLALGHDLRPDDADLWKAAAPILPHSGTKPGDRLAWREAVDAVLTLHERRIRQLRADE